MSFGGTFDLIDPPIWDIDIIDDIMDDTGDILDDLEQTLDDIESTRHVIIPHLIGWNLLDFKVFWNNGITLGKLMIVMVTVLHFLHIQTVLQVKFLHTYKTPPNRGISS